MQWSNFPNTHCHCENICDWLKTSHDVVLTVFWETSPHLRDCVSPTITQVHGVSTSLSQAAWTSHIFLLALVSITAFVIPAHFGHQLSASIAHSCHITAQWKKQAAVDNDKEICITNIVFYCVSISVIYFFFFLVLSCCEAGSCFTHGRHSRATDMLSVYVMFTSSCSTATIQDVWCAFYL